MQTKSHSEADPSLWTLRFKNHKTTILLLVPPATPFPSIKAQLLSTITSLSPGSFNGHALPSSPDAISFGIPVDRNNVEKGWVGIDIPSTEVEAGEGKRKRVGGKHSVLNESPQAAGLKDGGMIAFRFKTGDEEVDEESMDIDDSKWDVVVPSYENENPEQSGTGI